jgi:hypothetical protein
MLSDDYMKIYRYKNWHAIVSCCFHFDKGKSSKKNKNWKQVIDCFNFEAVHSMSEPNSRKNLVSRLALYYNELLMWSPENLKNYNEKTGHHTNRVGYREFELEYLEKYIAMDRQNSTPKDIKTMFNDMVIDVWKVAEESEPDKVKRARLWKFDGSKGFSRNQFKLFNNKHNFSSDRKTRSVALVEIPQHLWRFTDEVPQTAHGKSLNLSKRGYNRDGTPIIIVDESSDDESDIEIVPRDTSCESDPLKMTMTEFNNARGAQSSRHADQLFISLCGPSSNNKELMISSERAATIPVPTDYIISSIFHSGPQSPTGDDGDERDEELCDVYMDSDNEGDFDTNEGVMRVNNEGDFDTNEGVMRVNNDGDFDTNESVMRVNNDGGFDTNEGVVRVNNDGGFDTNEGVVRANLVDVIDANEGVVRENNVGGIGVEEWVGLVVFEEEFFWENNSDEN